jgi:hypothetical protein
VVRGDRAVRVKLVGPEGPELVAADAVIVTLGTYATPAALLRSGIGPPAELARHGIAPVAPLEAVGRGMQDHPKVSYRFDPRRAGPALAEPLVPVPADRGPRGRPRAARLPGDALLGHRLGRPALHRPQRPGRRRPLAAGDRAPPEHRPGRPAGDRHGLVPRATDRAASSSPAGACSRWPRRRPWPRPWRPGPAWPTPTTSCARSRPSTTRSAAAAWATPTTLGRSSTPPGGCSAALARHNRGSRAPPVRGRRRGARITGDDERTRCPSSHRPPRRTPATPP